MGTLYENHQSGNCISAVCIDVLGQVVPRDESTRSLVVRGEESMFPLEMLATARLKNFRVGNLQAAFRVIQALTETLVLIVAFIFRTCVHRCLR